jgi:hypothetical protein
MFVTACNNIGIDVEYFLRGCTYVTQPVNTGFLSCSFQNACERQNQDVADMGKLCKQQQHHYKSIHYDKISD